MGTSISAKLKIRDNKYVVIYHRNKIWRTGVSIQSKDEFNNGKLTSRYKGEQGYKELNNFLQEKLQIVNKLITEAVKNNLDSLDYIDTYYKSEQDKLTRLKLNNNTPVWIAYKDYIDLKIKKIKDLKAPRTIDRYRSEISRLEDYHKTCPSTLEDLQDETWFSEFCRWLSTPYKKTYFIESSKYKSAHKVTKTLKQTNATISRFLQDLITFMKKIQHSCGILFPLEEVNNLMNSLTVPDDDPENVLALTRNQWEAYKRFNPNPELPWEEKTYDLYRFCVNTGLRYSDVVRLNDIYVENNIITMRAEKNRNQFTIEMNREAIIIYNKYGRDFRNKFPTDQQLNENLRNILKQITEFNVDTIWYEYVLSEVKEHVDKLYAIYSFHSSRRSFVTFSLQYGAKEQQIKKWTGWKDNRTIKSYTKIFGEMNNNDSQILNFI
jgi:integrase